MIFINVKSPFYFKSICVKLGFDSVISLRSPPSSDGEVSSSSDEPQKYAKLRRTSEGGKR